MRGLYRSIATVHDFVEQFRSRGRDDQFSHAALEELFEYLSMAADLEPMELDVVGICCDWTEYETDEELAEAYGSYEEACDNHTVLLTGIDSYLVST